MTLKEAREIVEGCQKLPDDKYQEAVAFCIEDDGKDVEVEVEDVENE